MGRTKSEKNPGNASWIFVINNYSDSDVKACLNVICKRFIAGYEVGEAGTRHIQGAIQFNRAVRMKACVKALGGRAHVEMMRGRWDQQDYCLKEGEIIRMVAGPDDKSGQRTDLEKFREAIKAGAKDIELLENHLTCCANHQRLLGFAKKAYAKERTKGFRQVKVHVRWGASGTGKTKYVMDMDDVYLFSDYEGMWFDGYEGEKILLIDEFYGGIKYSDFLRILDGYQIRRNVKNSHTYGEWTTIYITSNKPPDEWYERGLTPALARRLTTVKELHGKGDIGGRFQDIGEDEAVHVWNSGWVEDSEVGQEVGGLLEV